MDIILAVIILALLCVLFYREIKNTKEVDLFINIVISAISIGSAIITFFQNDFKFGLISDYINIAVVVVAVVFTVYYLVKYFRAKKVEA